LTFRPGRRCHAERPTPANRRRPGSGPVRTSCRSSRHRRGDELILRCTARHLDQARQHLTTETPTRGAGSTPTEGDAKSQPRLSGPAILQSGSSCRPSPHHHYRTDRARTSSRPRPMGHPARAVVSIPVSFVSVRPRPRTFVLASMTSSRMVAATDGRVPADLQSVCQRRSKIDPPSPSARNYAEGRGAELLTYQGQLHALGIVVVSA
jgi:hypothetical protein